MRGNYRHHTFFAVRYGCNLSLEPSQTPKFPAAPPPWLNLYFCCSATKIKEKDYVFLIAITAFLNVGFHQVNRDTSFYCRGANAICVGDVFREANTLRTPMCASRLMSLAVRYGCNPYIYNFHFFTFHSYLLLHIRWSASTLIPRIISAAPPASSAGFLNFAPM